MPSPLIPTAVVTVALVLGANCTSEDVVRMERRTCQELRLDVESVPNALKGLSAEVRAAGLEAKSRAAWAGSHIAQGFGLLKRDIKQARVPGDS